MSDNTVKLTLVNGDEETDYELKPTFLAASKIPKAFGGYMPAIDAVAKLDMGAIEVVVAHGMGLTAHGQKTMNLPERIYETGVAKVATPCVEFLTILMNGGKRPTEDTEEAKVTEGEA